MISNVNDAGAAKRSSYCYFRYQCAVVVMQDRGCRPVTVHGLGHLGRYMDLRWRMLDHQTCRSS